MGLFRKLLNRFSSAIRRKKRPAPQSTARELQPEPPLVKTAEPAPALARKNLGGPKIIILIPTRNRAVQYLRATVLSAARQAERHEHDVEIVVSDLSGEAHSRRNAQTIESLRKRISTPLHYYPKKENSKIMEALREATRQEKNAFRVLAPQNGFWGANRNRLALLAVYHGGENAVYLHLDDDSPLLSLEEETSTIQPNRRDEIRLFLEGLGRAKNFGRQGYAGVIKGVEAAIVSAGGGPQKPPNLREQLMRKTRTYGGSFKGGAGRIFSFDAMTWAYHPFERGEANFQQDRYSELHWDAPSRDGVPVVLHIGASGWTPEGTEKEVDLGTLAGPWASLVKRMAELGKKEREEKQTSKSSLQ